MDDEKNIWETVFSTTNQKKQCSDPKTPKNVTFFSTSVLYNIKIKSIS